MQFPQSKLLPSKKQEKSYQSLNKGLMLLKGKLYKQASIELKVAMDLYPEYIKNELNKLFNKYDDNENIEAALTIGLLLLQSNKDSELANKLGNFSRQLKNYHQANTLYRQALKINRNNKLAFYNLAASLGKVPRYDLDIIKSIEQFITVQNYVLPEYISDPNIIDTINISATLSADSSDDSYRNFLDIVEHKLNVKTDDNMSVESKTQLHKELFDLGVFALSKNDTASALDIFLKLKSENSDLKNVDMCIALATDQNGYRSEATRIMKEVASKNIDSRCFNVNFGLLLEKAGNRLLSLKHKAMAAYLMEKSKGMFHMSEVMETANELLKQEKIEQALRLYEIVAKEEKNIKAWLYIGEIKIMQKKFGAAISAFREIQKIEPNSKLAENKLLLIHNHYCQKAEEHYNRNHISQAAVLYERAISLVRIPETIDKLIVVYKRLNKDALVQKYLSERRILIEQQKDLEIEKICKQHIFKGKQFLKIKDYESAITCFEDAFKLKADKDVFAYLAYIYKGLNRKRMLKSLVERWQMAKEYEDRRRKRKERQGELSY